MRTYRALRANRLRGLGRMGIISIDGPRLPIDQIPVLNPILQNAGPVPTYGTPGSYPYYPTPLPPTPDPSLCPSWGCDGYNPLDFYPYLSTQPTQPSTVASAINPATGQVVTSIPANGPLPPGYGYQQVEAPGSPYPYVYIGGGGQSSFTEGAPWNASQTYYQGDTVTYAGTTWTALAQSIGIAPGSNSSYWSASTNYYGSNYYGSPYSSYSVAAPWSVYTSYYPGQTVSYGGVTWTALAQSIGIAPGSNSGYWTMAGGSPYAASPYNLPLSEQTTSLPAGSMVGGQVVSPASATSSFTAFFNQYKWYLLGGLAAVVVLPRVLPRR